MRKILIIAILLIIPLSYVWAFEMKAWKEVSVNEMINNDLYIAAWRVDINAEILWDLVISWWDLNINSNIWEDLTIAWWQINVFWDVWDDVKIAWWSIMIDWNIAWDLIVWWWEVRIKKWVIIDWDIIVWWWRLVLDWTVKWNAIIYIWEFVLNWNIDWNTKLYIKNFKNPENTWVIKWNLDYTSSMKNVELESIVSWTSNFKKIIIDKTVKNKILWFLTIYILIKLIWLFIFSTLLYFLFKKLFNKVSLILKNETLKSFLYWFLTIILTPIIIILLFISIIWIPFAFLLLFTYIFLFVFMALINTIIISSLIINKYKIWVTYKKVLVILWFTILFWITNWINPIVWLFTIWAILINKQEIIKSLR